jgi:hypothetical protein
MRGHTITALDEIIGGCSSRHIGDGPTNVCSSETGPEFVIVHDIQPSRRAILRRDAWCAAFRTVDFCLYIWTSRGWFHYSDPIMTGYTFTD